VRDDDEEMPEKLSQVFASKVRAGAQTSSLLAAFDFTFSNISLGTSPLFPPSFFFCLSSSSFGVGGPTDSDRDFA
jgi:hypothetical protein